MHAAYLQLRGGPSEQQRATYQPFNLVLLILAGIGMALSGQIDRATLVIVALCCSLTYISAVIGAQVYTAVSEATFRRAVLVLLLVSGMILLVQSVLK